MLLPYNRELFVSAKDIADQVGVHRTSILRWLAAWGTVYAIPEPAEVRTALRGGQIAQIWTKRDGNVIADLYLKHRAEYSKKES